MQFHLLVARGKTPLNVIIQAAMYRLQIRRPRGQKSLLESQGRGQKKKTYFKRIKCNILPSTRRKNSVKNILNKLRGGIIKLQASRAGFVGLSYYV